MHTELYDYFKKIARFHPDLLHDPDSNIRFYRSASEANNAQKARNAKWPCMICIGYDWQYINNPDAIIKRYDFEVWIVGKAPSHTAFDAMHQVWEQTAVITDKVLGRIHQDVISYIPSPAGNFRIHEAYGEQIGPVFDSGFGHSLKLPLRPSGKVTFDNSEWDGYAL